MGIEVVSKGKHPSHPGYDQEKLKHYYLPYLVGLIKDFLSSRSKSLGRMRSDERKASTAAFPKETRCQAHMPYFTWKMKAAKAKSG
jgi:hypothetical protein